MLSSDNRNTANRYISIGYKITMNEITIDELHNLAKDSYELIDIRDAGLVLYGMIPGAINISLKDLEKNPNSDIDAIPKNKKLIFYCEIGRASREIDDLA